MGHRHIPRHFAAPINLFYQDTFNPWLNLHRPCTFAVETVDAKGKISKRYPRNQVKTPLNALALLNEKGRVKFKPGQSVKALQAAAKAHTDLAVAKAMQRAKLALFAAFAREKKGLKDTRKQHRSGDPVAIKDDLKSHSVSRPVSLRSTGLDTL